MSTFSRHLRCGCLGAALLAAACTRGGGEGAIAITHGTVIDGTGAPPRAEQTVVVRGNRIAAVGADGGVRVPAGARRISGRGKWLIPGLWDMHVHALEYNFPDFTGPLMLAHGVTGARDMGFYVDSGVHWRGEVAAGRVAGLRLVVSGRIDYSSTRPWVVPVDAPERARHVVDSLIDAGADFIKIYSYLTEDAYFAAADQARRRGVPIAGHVPFGIGMDDAARAGQRSIEHEEDLVRACEGDLRSLVNPPPPGPEAVAMLRADGDARCERAYTALRQAGVWATPTLAIYQPHLTPGDSAVIHPSLMRYVPRAVQVQWHERVHGRVGFFLRSRPTAGEMRRRGLRLLAGTDAPLAYLHPGMALHDELALLVSGGLTPMQALQSATREPAAYLGALGSLGTIQPGRVADLVLLDADPLADIRNTRRIRHVIANGRIVNRATLLRRAETFARRSAEP